MPPDTGATNPSSRDGSSTWTKLGLRRAPWLTGALVAVTGAGGIAQHILPDLLGQLERSPAGLQGQWWRIVTALLVQDGGLFGLVSNMIFLGAIGAVAEQVCTRRRWMVQYFGTGLLAELVGYAWQPIGGGNSIAICGLASAVAVTAWRDRVRLAPWGLSAVLVWCGALLAPLWEPLILLGIIAGVAAGRAVQTGRRAGPAVLVGVLVAGAVLSAAANIHGAAILIGAVLALLPGKPRRT
ncbi:MAG: rhomboid family intramembrane serine protease [Microlunatus sp.]|nr:rhomboid family intramembrane serine protease [Microlunatus sp.]